MSSEKELGTIVDELHMSLSEFRYSQWAQDLINTAHTAKQTGMLDGLSLSQVTELERIYYQVLEN